MIKFLRQEKWSPYIAGIFIGLLAMISLVVFQKTIGVSTTFVKLAAFFWSLLDPSHVQNNPYYQEYLNQKAWFDWQFMLVLGIFLGSLLSFRSSGAQKTAGSLQRKSPISKRRMISALIGGVIVMFGARLAGGCTSGHAISGGFQLALSGWLFMAGAFALGIPTALILYRNNREKIYEN